MKTRFLILALFLCCVPAAQAAAPVSDDTQTCLDCHVQVTPGIVADWQASRHAAATPAQAMKKTGVEAKISAKSLPGDLAANAVGCAECHTMRSGKHPGTFDHEDFKVHTVVSPEDCAVCHTEERAQFKNNLMAHARGNLLKNPLYMDLAKQANGVQTVEGLTLKTKEPTANDQAESCFYCHGTEIKPMGLQIRETELGEMSFTKLGGWPNHGVGRVNPDGSKGSCAACHSRHRFSIAVARSAYTCAECHKGPDVPAFKVYEVSRHGALFFAEHKDWDMTDVPWTVGEDFNAPTCAACHVSLLTDAEDTVIAQRTHAMGDRIWVRLLGLVCSHPHPKSPDTSIIKSSDGLPLATSLDGKPAGKYLISQEEQARRRLAMRDVCQACHSEQWAEGQLKRIDSTNASADAMVLAATKLVQLAWQKGLAKGPAQGGSPFDEYVERLWVDQWLIHANGSRFATAMMGPDIGVFESGRWHLAKNLRRIQDWLRANDGQ